MTSEISGELIWQDLDRQLQEDEPEHEGVWSRLKETANISNYQPAQAPGVVHQRLESKREGIYYMLNNHPGWDIPEAGREGLLCLVSHGRDSVCQAASGGLLL